MNLRTVLITSALSCMAGQLSAKGLAENLDKAFESLGMVSNTTTAGGYQNQSGGYYTGGSVFARSSVNTAKVYALQMPRFRAGCGGIDFFKGGFSFINGDQFKNLIRSIPGNASGYAIQLAIDTVSPMVGMEIKDLLAKVQTATNANINSCEAAATLVGGVWPQSNASSQLLCGAMSKDLGLATDWVEARQHCGEKFNPDEAKSGPDNGGVLTPYKAQLGSEFNIVWKAINNNAFLSADKELAQFFMTVTGTIVSRKVLVTTKDKKAKGNQHGNEIKYFKSKALNKDFIKGLILGGQDIEYYACDNTEAEKCLYPNIEKKKLLEASVKGKSKIADREGWMEGNIQARPRGSGLLNQVEVMLHNISERVRVDSTLSPEELAFVNSTRLPILKMISIEMAYRSGLGPVHIREYAEAIAYDILLGYLDEVIGVVMDSLDQLQKVQVSDGTINEFRADIRQVRREIFNERTNLFHQIMLTLETMERAQQIEAKLQNAFISYQQGARGE